MPVSGHMFHLADVGSVLGPPLSFDNGLACVRPGGIVVFTGISSGPVFVIVDARDTPPESIELADWEEVVEVSTHASVGRMVVSGVFSDAPPLPVLTTAGPGDYRVRLHARGRDRAVDLGVIEPTEDYLVIAWPAPLAPEAIMKRSDQYGAGLRRPRRRSPERAVQSDLRGSESRDRLRARLRAEEEKFHRRG